MNFNFSAEELALGTITAPWGGNGRLRVVDSNACCGSKSFSSQGLGFWGTTPPTAPRIYELQTPLFTSSVTNLNLITVGFAYRIYMPVYPGSTNTPPAAPPAWHYEVILREYDTAVPANVTDYNISGGTVNGSGNTKDYNNPSVDGCAAFFVGSLNRPLNTGYSYRLIIRFWTENTNTSTQNFVTIDCIKTQSNVLTSDINEELNGLSEPTYTKNTGTGYISNFNLVADLTLSKSAQSAVSCGTDSSQSSNVPHCQMGGVKGIYYVQKHDKSTGDFISIVKSEPFAINYGSSSSTPLSKTAAVFEDDSYIYRHFVGYEVWSTDNDWDVVMKHEEFTAPVWPTKNLQFGFVAVNNTGLPCDVTMEVRQNTNGSTYDFVDDYVADSSNWSIAPDLNQEYNYIAQVKPVVTPSDNSQVVVITVTKKESSSGAVIDTFQVNSNDTIEWSYLEMLDGYYLEVYVSIETA